MKQTISIIAAIGKNRELGKDNGLIWNIPSDLQRFREITSGKPVIMGRKTYESIGRALPKRTNIIVTRNTSYQAPSCIVTHSIDEALQKAEECAVDEVFVIGGAQLYTQALPYADRLYLTIIDHTFDADTFFPDYSAFCIESESPQESDGYRYTYTTFKKC